MKRAFYTILSILMLLLGVTFTPNVALSVYADEIAYFGVIDDLSKDSTFDVANYPEIEDDYSLSVIQIAESVNDELFVFVYNPSADRVATSINISIDSSLPKNYINYELSLIDSSETLAKYKLEDFVVLDNDTRYYEITSIYRLWDANVDEAPSESQIITEIPYKVNRLYEFVGFDDELQVTCTDVDYIKVVDKFVGFCRYSGSGNFWQQIGSIFTGAKSCDSHFIAFSTDKQIDKLLEADVYFVTQTASYHDLSGDTTYGEFVDMYSHLTSDQDFTYAEGKWSYTPGRIQTTADFIKTESEDNVYDSVLYTTYQHNKITSAAISDIQSKEWILRFYESPYVTNVSISSGGLNENYTYVQDVSIMRLKFESDGVVYELGVIDNKQQSATHEPINEQHYSYKPSWLFWLIIVIVILVVLAPWLPSILKFIWNVIKWVAKAIWWVITLPYRLIKKIIDRRRNE